jgi:tRNA threonylcarbamoyladenosine biosynthesis protein TsaB
LVQPVLNILAIETSSEWCSAAIWLDGRVQSREEQAGQRHSELILPMVDGLLREAGIELAALDVIAFGAGPGSFTGLRVACGVAQGLAFAAGVPVAEVSTLLALAQASGAERVVSCLDARMGELYFAAFERATEPGSGPQWITVHSPRLCAPVSAPELDGSGWIGAGGGFAAHGAALAQRYAGRLSQTRAELHPHARDIAALAVEVVREGLAVPAEQARPVYLRDRVALTVEERRALKASRAAGTEQP